MNSTNETSLSLLLLGLLPETVSRHTYSAGFGVYAANVL